MEQLYSERPLSQLTEYYYDLFSGQLMIGKVALSEHIETGGDLYSIYELCELLRNTDIPIEYNRYDRIDVSEWKRQDYLLYGQWLISAARTNNDESELNRDILQRASLLGIGPSLSCITSPDKFGSVSNYLRQLRVGRTQWKRLYSGWSEQDFVQSMHDLAEEIGGKPTEPLMWRLIRDNGRDIPSPYVIGAVFGTLGNLLELDGWPNVRAMTKDDYVELGVMFMLVNGRIPTSSSLRILSGKKRSPSDRNIMDNFDNLLSNFQTAVKDAYDTKLQQLQEDLDTNRLPASLVSDAEIRAERVILSARYKLVNRLLNDINPGHIVIIARSKSLEDFVSLIRQHDPRLTEAKIKETAKSLGVFSDIWKLCVYMETLKVPAPRPAHRPKKS